MTVLKRSLITFEREFVNIGGEVTRVRLEIDEVLLEREVLRLANKRKRVATAGGGAIRVTTLAKPSPR